VNRIHCLICGIPEDRCQSTKCREDAHRLGIELVECIKTNEHYFVLSPEPVEWSGIDPMKQLEFYDE